MRQMTIVSCVLLAFAAAAVAERVTDPPWVTYPNDPQWVGGSPTSQTWEFNTLLPYPHTMPFEVDNPWGDPELTVINGNYPDWVAGTDPTGGEIPTWHIGPDGLDGGIDILVWNDPTPRDQKIIYIQITSDKAPGPTSPTVPGGTTTYPQSPWQIGGTPYYVYTAQIDLPFNPPYEWIHYDFPESTNIAEIVIDTLCIPEPMTLALLGVGAVALIRRRR